MAGLGGFDLNSIGSSIGSLVSQGVSQGANDVSSIFRPITAQPSPSSGSSSSSSGNGNSGSGNDSGNGSGDDNSSNSSAASSPSNTSGSQNDPSQSSNSSPTTSQATPTSTSGNDNGGGSSSSSSSNGASDSSNRVSSSSPNDNNSNGNTNNSGGGMSSTTALPSSSTNSETSQLTTPSSTSMTSSVRSTSAALAPTSRDTTSIQPTSSAFSSTSNNRGQEGAGAETTSDSNQQSTEPNPDSESQSESLSTSVVVTTQSHRVVTLVTTIGGSGSGSGTDMTSKGGLSGSARAGIIAGSVIGGLAVLAIIALLVLLGRRRRSKRRNSSNEILWPQIANSVNDRAALYPEPARPTGRIGLDDDDIEYDEGLTGMHNSPYAHDATTIPMMQANMDGYNSTGYHHPNTVSFAGDHDEPGFASSMSGAGGTVGAAAPGIVASNSMGMGSNGVNHSGSGSALSSSEDWYVYGNHDEQKLERAPTGTSTTYVNYPTLSQDGGHGTESNHQPYTMTDMYGSTPEQQDLSHYAMMTTDEQGQYDSHAHSHEPTSPTSAHPHMLSRISEQTEYPRRHAPY